MALKIRVGGTFTDPTLPKWRDDPNLSDGSLVLLEPGRDGETTGGDAPATIPNLAWKEAAALTGAAQGDLDATLSVVGAFTGTVGKVERTAKGGIHGIASQANGAAST